MPLAVEQERIIEAEWSISPQSRPDWDKWAAVTAPFTSPQAAATTPLTFYRRIVSTNCFSIPSASLHRHHTTSKVYPISVCRIPSSNEQPTSWVHRIFPRDGISNDQATYTDECWQEIHHRKSRQHGIIRSLRGIIEAQSPPNRLKTMVKTNKINAFSQLPIAPGSWSRQMLMSGLQ